MTENTQKARNIITAILADFRVGLEGTSLGTAWWNQFRTFRAGLMTIFVKHVVIVETTDASLKEIFILNKFNKCLIQTSDGVKFRKSLGESTRSATAC
jgi:hypothetical protein